MDRQKEHKVITGKEINWKNILFLMPAIIIIIAFCAALSSSATD